ncbi:hypothetical protein PS3A_17360 [Pseudomonas sp. 3A(2025)]
MRLKSVVLAVPTVLLSAGIAVLGAVNSCVQAASFDCNKASTDIEQMICETPSLSKRDEQLAAAFKPLKNRRSFQLIESDWLTTVRDECESTQCLEEAYAEQVGFLTARPDFTPVDEKDLTVLPTGKTYVQGQNLWQNWSLAGLPGSNTNAQRHIVAVSKVSGILHVIAFEGSFDHTLFCDRGKLYEYVDKSSSTPPFFKEIAQDVCLESADDLGGNEEGKRFAGVLDGTFYYRQRVGRNELKSMAYRLGSNTPPQESSRLFQQVSNTLEHQKAVLLFTRDNSYSQLGAFHVGANKTEIIIPPNEPGTDWSIYNPTWSKQRPVVYFLNGPGDVWRADLITKTLVRVVHADQEGRIRSVMPIEINGREAILYLEDFLLTMAIAPD